MSSFLPPNVFPATIPSKISQEPNDFRTGNQLFSLVTSTHEVARDRYTIQVAQDRTADEKFMKNLPRSSPPSWRSASRRPPLLLSL